MSAFLANATEICQFLLQILSVFRINLSLYKRTKMNRLLWMMSYLLLASSSGIIAQTTVSHSFVNQGVVRNYNVYVPASYDGSVAFPVVFNLHGYTSDNVAQAFYGDFRPIADTAGFLVVHPNGTLDASSNRYWNAFNSAGVNDVQFFDALIDSLHAQYTIDLNRVYSCGMSNGGFMSYELACQLGNRIAAVANVTGSMGHLRMAACNPLKPTPAMHIHGTADMTVPYNGNAQFAAIDDVVDFWLEQTNASTNAIFMQWPDLDPSDGCTAEWYIYEDGDRGSSVELFKVIGGGHTWPGAPVTIGVTNQDFSASEQIWRFFSQFELQQLLSVDQLDEMQVRVYPNPSHGRLVIESPVQLTEIRIHDAAGRVVEQRLLENELSIELQLNIQPGIYFLSAFSTAGVLQRTIVMH